MRFIRHTGTGFSAAAALIFLLLFALPSMPLAQGPEKITVVYGGSDWLGHFPAWVAIKKGSFKRHGIGVLFQDFFSSSNRMDSLLAKELDFVSTGGVSAIRHMAAGNQDFLIFGTQDSYTSMEGIIGKRNIKSIKGLKGKKVAVPFSSSAHILLLDLLEQNGLKADKDVKLMHFEVTEMQSAINSGKVDACAAWSPYYEKLLKMKGTRLIANDTAFSLYQKYRIKPGPDVLVVRKEFAKKYPNTCQAFVSGYFEGVNMLINRPQEAALYIIGLTNLKLPEQLEALKNVQWFGSASQIDLMIEPGSFVTGMQQLAEFMARHQLINDVPDIRKWIIPSLVARR